MDFRGWEDTAAPVSLGQTRPGEELRQAELEI